MSLPNGVEVPKLLYTFIFNLHATCPVHETVIHHSVNMFMCRVNKYHRLVMQYPSPTYYLLSTKRLYIVFATH